MGAKAAADFMAGFFAQFEVQISYASAEIVVIGEWAFDRGSFRQTLNQGAGGQALARRQLPLAVSPRSRWRWKHTRVTWNVIGPVDS